MKRFLLISLLAVLIAFVSCQKIREIVSGTAENLKDKGPQITQDIVERDWLGLGITVGTAVISAAIGAFATKKRKDGQIRQIVNGVDDYKEGLSKNHTEALHDSLELYQTKATEALVKKILAKRKK